MKLSFIEKAIVVLIAVVGVFAALSNHKSNIKTLPEEPPKAVISEEKPAVDLGMTFEEFAQSYNEKIRSRGSQLRNFIIDTDKVEFHFADGAQNFFYIFPEYINVRGTINLETGMLTKVEVGCDLYNSRVTDMLYGYVRDATLKTFSKKLPPKFLSSINKDTSVVEDGFLFKNSYYKGLTVTSVELPSKH